MFESLRSLYLRRDLLYMITWREIRIKYKQSVMGYFWALLMPMLIVMAGVLVRYAYSIISNTPFTADAVASIAVKALPWAFFVSSLRFTSNSLIANTNLVTKIYMPREIFPISAVLSQLMDMAVAATALVVILGVLGIGVSVYLLWLPVLLAGLILLVIGLGVFLSAACLFFRDVKYIVEVIVTFAIFVTPVFFEVSMFKESGDLLLLNPIAPLLEGINAVVVLHRSPDIGWLVYSLVVALFTFVVAFVLFKRWESSFAESI